MKMCLFFISFLFLFSCSSNGGEEINTPDVPEIVTPTNLVLTIDILGSNANNPDGDGTGVIQCTATATNAVRYGFKIGNTTEVSDNDGVFQHTFNIEGTQNYLVTVFAYSSTGQYVSTFKMVSVYVKPSSGDQLVWSDEFDTNGPLNTSKWTYDLGTGNNGWGNGELQTYTNNLENVKVENGLLKITAIKNGSSYTSARIKSENLFEFTYGKVEVKAKLPASQGTWPAIWMLGANFDTVGWPKCGEIDIMEQTGSDKSKVLATCHWFNNASSNTASYGLDTSILNASSEFHIYGMEWTTSYIKMFLDGEQYYEIALNSELPFQNDCFFILNVAIGGTLGGTINPNFTQDSMQIDYIRVYK